MSEPEIIPKERYCSREHMEREWERMWTRTWQLAGREADIANAGDQLVLELGRESILLVRGHDRVVRAFYNVCSHRGTRLVACAQKGVSTLRCPYHSWEYHLDGRIKHIRDAASFRGIDPAEMGLTALRCESWQGLVWVHMDANAPSLVSSLGTLATLLEPYRIEEHHLVRDVTVEWACNWKVLVDNGNETYHVHAVHPQLLELLDDRETEPLFHGEHSSLTVRFGLVSPRLGSRHDVPPEMAGLLAKLGMEPRSFDGRISEVREAIGRAARAQFVEQRKDYPELSDQELADNLHAYVFPNVMFNFLLPGYWIFRVRPHPDDPERCFFDFQEYERTPEGEHPPPRPEHRSYRHGEISLDNVLDQDAAIAHQVQLGMRSRAFRGLVLGAQEQRLLHMHRTLERYLGV